MHPGETLGRAPGDIPGNPTGPWTPVLAAAEAHLEAGTYGSVRVISAAGRADVLAALGAGQAVRQTRYEVCIAGPSHMELMITTLNLPAALIARQVAAAGLRLDDHLKSGGTTSMGFTVVTNPLGLVDELTRSPGRIAEITRHIRWTVIAALNDGPYGSDPPAPTDPAAELLGVLLTDTADARPAADWAVSVDVLTRALTGNIGLLDVARAETRLSPRVTAARRGRQSFANGRGARRN